MFDIKFYAQVKLQDFRKKHRQTTNFHLQHDVSSIIIGKHKKVNT